MAIGAIRFVSANLSFLDGAVVQGAADGCLHLSAVIIDKQVADLTRRAGWVVGIARGCADAFAIDPKAEHTALTIRLFGAGLSFTIAAAAAAVAYSDGIDTH